MEHSASRLAPRTEKILRVTLLGSLSNALLVVLKLTVGILGHSSAMIAEAINSLSDFATDLIALIFIRISGKPQDEDHHYGHGKFETLATLVMAGVMLGVGVSLLYRSLSTTLQLLLGRLVLPQPSRLTLLIAALSLIIKLGLYLYTQRWAQRLDSSALRTKALDHRGDMLTLCAVLLGISGAIALGPRGLFLEPLAAAIVSLCIIYMGWSSLLPACKELTEVCLSPEVEEEIRSIIYAAEEVQGINQLHTRSLGQCYAIEVDILVSGSMTVHEGHEVTIRLEQSLMERFGWETHISIHVEPA